MTHLEARRLQITRVMTHTTASIGLAQTRKELNIGGLPVIEIENTRSLNQIPT